MSGVIIIILLTCLFVSCLVKVNILLLLAFLLKNHLV